MRTLALLLLLLPATAQDAPPNGPRRIDPGWHALYGATVHQTPTASLMAPATIVIRDGKIAEIYQKKPRPGPRVWDCKGMHIYAGFIDAHVPVASEGPEPRHWNTKVTPERFARTIDNATGEELRKLGFTAAVAAPNAGIFRGHASLVALTPNDPDRSVARPTVYREHVYQAMAFERFRRSDDGFPTSQMGAIAVMRQGFLDGLAPGQTLLFDTADELEALRAARVAAEAKRKAILLGSGLEFRRLHAIAATPVSVIAPLRLPPLPEIASLDAQRNTDLRALMTWEQAPTNLRRLTEAGVKVALTTSRLKRREAFWKTLRRLVNEERLDAPDALAMLTTNPAEILGMGEGLGRIRTKTPANLVVTDGPLFDEGTRILSVWIDGKRHEIAQPSAAGSWSIETDAFPARTLTIDRRERLRIGKKRVKHGRVRGRRIHFAFEIEDRLFTLSGGIDGEAMRGHGVGPGDARFTWTAKRTAPLQDERKDPPVGEIPASYGYPFGPYALDALPERDHLVVTNATVWTCGPDGVVENGELEVKDGKVAYVGKARDAHPDGARVIDARGKHVTPGIVDCHSHTGISKGINDSGQAVTAEVRIGDVTNPDSISWYRQLAGGVTTVNSLHGSANPIGGQSQTNKVRWGVRHPDDMHFEGAMPGIKFALGENVKQSNWGDDYTKRYPQTRMGVETLMRDRFVAARDYLKGHERTDLELEALSEILAGKRLIHCHSYRQDEILMLCRLAEEFGFRIGTFQHVLEGYKVAEAIREHAIGGSAFSDWWAYKVEVQDAIPHNGALMHDVGVLVSFNSDSDELARRLNVEAAKAVRYGGVPPAEALKFVTINPATQLGVGDRVGSLEKGKDADFALWSADPLSTYARCEATWVDGRNYFSLEKDAAHRKKIAAERRRIIDKILKTKRERKRDDEDEDEAEPVWWVRRFQAARAGECGCFEGEER